MKGTHVFPRYGFLKVKILNPESPICFTTGQCPHKLSVVTCSDSWFFNLFGRKLPWKKLIRLEARLLPQRYSNESGCLGRMHLLSFWAWIHLQHARSTSRMSSNELRAKSHPEHGRSPTAGTSKIRSLTSVNLWYL